MDPLNHGSLSHLTRSRHEIAIWIARGDALGRAVQAMARHFANFWRGSRQRIQALSTGGRWVGLPRVPSRR